MSKLMIQFQLLTHLVSLNLDKILISAVLQCYFPCWQMKKYHQITSDLKTPTYISIFAQFEVADSK